MFVSERDYCTTATGTYKGVNRSKLWNFHGMVEVDRRGVIALRWISPGQARVVCDTSQVCHSRA